MLVAIKHMGGHSSPGMDGLLAAFYQLAPSVFREYLQTVFDINFAEARCCILNVLQQSPCFIEMEPVSILGTIVLLHRYAWM